MISYGQFLMSHRRKILIWTVACLAVFALVGFFVVPPILKSVLTKQLTAALRREVSIREVRVNPVALSATLRGFAVKEPKSPETFVSFEELYINLEASSLFRWGVVVKELRLTKPFFRVVRHQDESYNFSDLLEGQKTQPSPTAKPLRFSVNNIRIIDGGADFQDDTVQVKHTVRELNVGVPFLSNIPSYIQIFVQPGLSMMINGTRYALQGKTKPFAESQETTLDVNITDLDLPYYLAYVPRELLTFALPSGRLDAKLDVVFIRQRTGGQTLTVKGDIGLRDLAVVDKQGSPVVRIPAFGIELASVEPFVRKVHLARVFLQSPELTVRREKTGTTNLETLLPKPAPAKQVAQKAPEPASESLVLDVDELSIAGAKVLFSDLFTRLPFKTTVDPVDVKVLQLSNRPDTKGSYTLTLKTEAKEEIALEGEVSLTPLSVDGSVEMKKLPLRKYAPYYSDSVLFDVASGTLDLRTDYQLTKARDALEIKLSGLSTSLRTVSLKSQNASQEFLNIPLLVVKNTSVDLAKREVHVGNLSTGRGTVLVSRSREGEVNFATLLPRTTAATKSLAVSSDAHPATSSPAEPERPWTVKAGSISVSQYRIQVSDEVPPEPVNLVLDDLSVKAERLSTALNSTPGKAALAFRVDKGTVSSEGTLAVAPVQADLQVAVNEIDIRPFQPYITDRVRVTITDGRLSTSGRLQISTTASEGLQAKFTGGTTLNKFAAIEKATADDVLNWGSLSLQELSAGYNPLFVHAKKVALADFFTHIIIQPNGRLNLQEIVIPSGATKPAESPQPAQPASAQAQPAKPDAAPPAAPSLAKDIQIEEVTLQGGRVQFQDRSLKPSYSANMTEIGGRVSGLSSAETSLADLELRGRMNNSAPLEITGKVNPLKQDLYADVRARFTGMDLSPTSPYSGKYVGYVIEKGKLSFDLKYLIEKRKLNSENKIFIDQFTFGEKVDSPTATNLPVKLAVALLKDRNGEIHLDLPVTGSLDDPKFSVWGVIVQIIGNLIAKAATSPFALLGAAFGGGEELQQVEFDYGLATIAPVGAKKLDALAKALSDRPSLKLEITGYVDPEADREGLKQYLLQRKVKAQKLNDLAKKGASAIPVDDVTVAPEEYEKYLTLAYGAEKFPKPRNLIGMVKSLPVSEMEKLILTHIEVGEEELRMLSSQRANAAKEAIVHAGQIDPERLFIVEPKTLAPEKKENLKSSRVEFKIG